MASLNFEKESLKQCQLFVPTTTRISNSHSKSSYLSTSSHCLLHHHNNMYFPNVSSRHQRSSIVRFPRQFIHNQQVISTSTNTNKDNNNNSSIFMSSSSSSSSDAQPQATQNNNKGTTEQSDPQRARHFTERLATARARGRQLHTLLLARYVQSATIQATSLLSSSAAAVAAVSSAAAADAASPSPDPTATSSSSSSSSKTVVKDSTDTKVDITTLARQLRKDLKSLRSTAEGALSADDAVWVSLARLQTLVEQLEKRSDQLSETASTYVRDKLQEDIEGGSSIYKFQQDTDLMNDNNSNSNKVNNTKERISSSFKRTVSGIEGRVSEFVKKDGSIDIDTLRGWIRKVLNSLSITWMRLNGREQPQNNTEMNKEKEIGKVLAKFANEIENSDENEKNEEQIREEIKVLEKDLNDRSKKRETLLRNKDQLELLIKAREIREMDDQVNSLRRILAVRVLQIEINKIFKNIIEEIINAEYDVLIVEQRILIIEFNELDIKLNTLNLFIEEDEPLLIDDNLLGELVNDIQDLKARVGLGSDYLYSSSTSAKTILSFDQVKSFMATTSKKTKTGVDFYWRGMKLFVGDVNFIWKLLNKVIIGGYTLNPREVRTLRRTGRDVLTLIPFTIVLIAPLTPVGHVLIFSFLQRYWPEFFPSTFSERRQSMMKKREVYLSMLQEDGEIENDSEMSEEEEIKEETDNGFMKSMKNIIQTPGSINLNDDNDNDNGINMIGGIENTIELDLIELTGGIRDKDIQARKERNKIALDDLHLAD